MQFPYGISDFQSIIESELFYVDRTQMIPAIEQAGRQLIFLRPRRFGKSLLLSMLENYYDIAKADKFQDLFGHLAIGKQPTSLHSSYVIMKWDFSLIAPAGNAEDIEKRLHAHINECIVDTAHKYMKQLLFPVKVTDDNAVASFQSLISAINNSSLKLYLLIDEYDNFANELMMGASNDHYGALLQGEGAVRSIFKAVKGAASGMGLERVFITGVSPIAMSDITSAYNVAKNIYLLPQFNQLCGFTEEEVTDVIRHLMEQQNLPVQQLGDVIAMMRTYYNGYRFARKSGHHVYNPTMVLYFLEHFADNGSLPENMLDSNLSMDRNKIHYIARLSHGAEVIGRVLDDSQSITVGNISERFGVRTMVQDTLDQESLLSLLYYLGALTLTDTHHPGRIGMRIPNLVMRRLYVEEIQGALLPTGNSDDKLLATEALYIHADIAPLCCLLEKRIFKILSNRDYRWSNELTVKMAFLATLFNDKLFIMDSEPELNRGYADMSMIVRPDMRHYGIFDVLVEFKFISLATLNMTGEAVADATEEALLKLPAIASAFDGAERQLSNYAIHLREKYGEIMKLCSFVVVAVGFNRLLWKKVEG